MLYDLNGNRLGKTGQRMGVEGKQEMNTVFCYDAMNRLTMENRREGGEKYAYDLNGNRLRKQLYHYALNADGDMDMDSVIDGEESYCYNERNELTERKSLSAVTAYLYDENGSLIKEKEGEKEIGYRYDLLNRQTHVHLPDGREQENLYDGEGLRAGLTEEGKSTTFLFYNGEILAECSGDSMPIRRHLAGQGLSHVQNLESNTLHAYHQDEQGSTAYVTGITGETENLYSYDGFGNILEKREDITNRILYTGQQYDQETGQYYLRARYYNPVIGRFTQEDTYRADGLNLYAYCGNNPVMYYDPSGHTKKQKLGCPSETNNKHDGTGTENASREGGGRTSNIPVPEEVIAENGLRYKSNDKHTLGQQGRQYNAGIEPKNSLELFGNSVVSTLPDSSMAHFAYDETTGTLHRFFDDGNGVWHWSGSTNQGANSLTSKFQLILEDYLICLRKDGKMVIGDPYVFSIIIDVVDEWNKDKVFNNGLLFMSIDGILFLPKLANATLNSELFQLIKNLKKSNKNEEIFKMGKKEAFVYIYNLTYPDDWDIDNDYRYTITPYIFEDNNCFVFMVSNGERIRILAASELQYIKEESTHNLQDIDVVETYILKEELENIIEKLYLCEIQIRND